MPEPVSDGDVHGTDQSTSHIRDQRTNGLENIEGKYNTVECRNRIQAACDGITMLSRRVAVATLRTSAELTSTSLIGTPRAFSIHKAARNKTSSFKLLQRMRQEYMPTDTSSDSRAVSLSQNFSKTTVQDDYASFFQATDTDQHNY
ncbi:hypothetical protein Bbelb_289310 [Branchiostoma belcheri]|nr:hypothetical protein Bbelb_289310 [Branchiostoma belcheri]